MTRESSSCPTRRSSSSSPPPPGWATTTGPLLPLTEALRQAEELLLVAPVVYPSAEVVRTALRGAATYQLSWFDAHLWACAEVHGIGEILSEDFEHGRRYGTVRTIDPFHELNGRWVHEGAG